MKEEEATNELMLTKTSSQLDEGDVQRYYKLEKGCIQEAFREFYKIGSPGAPQEIPNKGCRTLYDDAQLASPVWLLYRNCMHEVKELLSNEEPSKIWLEGKTGSGKSMALVSAVEWARQKNWLVLYLPSAAALLSDSFFAKRAGTEFYDTIVAAKDILKSVYSVYGGEDGALSSLPQTRNNNKDSTLGQTLDDLCRIGLSTGDPAIACDAAVKLLDEFLFGDHGVEKLVAVDDYNALYWKTQYFYWKSDVHKVMIPVENITLANAFRILERQEAPQSRILVAPTRSSGISSSIWIPKQEPVNSFTIPPFAEDEMHCALYYYWKRDLIKPVDIEALRRLAFVTGGNMHDLKRLLAVL